MNINIAVFTEVAVFGDANLELPSFLSNRSAVEIHMDVGLNIFSKQENEWEINIGLPVHARYTVRETEYISKRYLTLVKWLSK